MLFLHVAKSKVKLDTHADTRVVGNNCLVIHNHNKPVNFNSYDPIDGHRSAKTVDAVVGYHDPQHGQRFILMIKQAIHIDGLVNHLLFSMQCHLNGMQVSEVPKLLALNPSDTTHAIELVDHFEMNYSS